MEVSVLPRISVPDPARPARRAIFTLPGDFSRSSPAEVAQAIRGSGKESILVSLEEGPAHSTCFGMSLDELTRIVVVPV